MVKADQTSKKEAGARDGETEEESSGVLMKLRSPHMKVGGGEEIASRIAERMLAMRGKSLSAGR